MKKNTLYKCNFLDFSVHRFVVVAKIVFYFLEQCILQIIPKLAQNCVPDVFIWAITAAVLRRGWEISNWWNLQWNNIVVGISLTLQTIFPSFSKLYFSEPRSAIAAVSQRREVGRSQTGGIVGGMILGKIVMGAWV